MNQKLIISSLITTVLCISLFSHLKVFATKVDLEEQISIKSDRQSADLKNKILDYVHNVVITQGTLSITADIVQIFSVQNTPDQEGGDTYLAKGKPAIFQQTLEDGSIITLEADKITYQPSLFLVKVSGNAKVKQASSEVTGSEITYNISTERLDAVRGLDEQVQTVLQPSTLKKAKKPQDKQDDTQQKSENNEQGEPSEEGS